MDGNATLTIEMSMTVSSAASVDTPSASHARRGTASTASGAMPVPPGSRTASASLIPRR